MKLPIKEEFLNGCLKDYPDKRDYIFETVFGAEYIDWKKGYEEKVINSLKVVKQEYGSCVGQSFAYYAEILELIENGIFQDLSPRFIYAWCKYLDGNAGQGTSLRHGAKVMVSEGVCLETLCSQFIDGKTIPYAKFIDIANIEHRAIKNAKIFASKDYYTTLHHRDIDIVARIVKAGHGCVSGAIGSNKSWSKPWVEPPKVGEKQWAHAIYLLPKFGIKDGKKYIKFINSWSEAWGEKGYGYLSEDYFKSGSIFNLRTLIDRPNIQTMNRVIKLQNQKDQWVVNEERKEKYRIPDLETRTIYEMVGWIGKIPNIVIQQEFDMYKDMGDLPSMKVHKAMKGVYQNLKDALNTKVHLWLFHLKS